MNRERAKARVFELLDERNPQPVPMTPTGIKHLAAELVHSIVDAIADELEAEAAADKLEHDMAVATGLPVGYALTRGQAEAIVEAQGSDPKGRKGYDY